MVGEQQLESEKRENALDAEGASIDEVSVEQVGIGFRWQSVLLEDVEKIKVLAVDVTTDRELPVVRDLDVHQRRLFP